MVLDGVDVFVEVVDAQSFSRAAKRLGMPAATVSSKVARLEERLGVTLIRRTTRKLFVTEAGRRYYEHCARALAELGNAERELAAVNIEPAGVLKLTVPEDVAQTLMPPVIERYLDAFPKMTVKLIVTNKMLDLVDEGIDLAVRVGSLASSTLTVRKFRSGKVGLWAAQSYLDRMGTPASPAELADHQFVRFDRMPLDMVLSSGQDSFVVDQTSRLITDEMENVRTFIRRGNGIGLLPEFVGQHFTDDGPLVRVLPDYTCDAGSAYFAYPAQAHVPFPVRAFIALATGEHA